jgi:hypothetical protein
MGRDLGIAGLLDVIFHIWVFGLDGLSMTLLLGSNVIIIHVNVLAKYFVFGTVSGYGRDEAHIKLKTKMLRNNISV